MQMSIKSRIRVAWKRHKKGDLAFAYRQYKNILQQDPNNADALHYLGLIAQQSNRPEEAISLIKASIAADGFDPSAYNHLAQIYHSSGMERQAMEMFEAAVRTDPFHVDSLNNLANMLRNCGKADDAIDLYRRALKQAPNATHVLFNLARVLKDKRAFEEAIDQLKKGIKIDKNYYRLHHDLALCYEEQGRFQDAARHYQEVLRIKPDHYKALANMISLRAFEPSLSLIDQAKRCLDKSEITLIEKAKLHNGLGKYFDRNAKFDEAFEHFLKSNQAQKEMQGPYDREKNERLFESLKTVFSSKTFSAYEHCGSASERPIFVVGMPRSGTTLTEQILTSHPQIFGAGELSEIPSIVQDLGVNYPECVTAARPELLEQSATRYLELIETVSPLDARFVVDKFPFNFLHIGLIYTLFPNAKLIHCRRNPIDTLLSCFVEMFDIVEQQFATDLDRIKEYILQKEMLMAHWKRVLPTTIFELQYETLVANQERETRRLINFCGVEWDDTCLNFHATNRQVTTPSRWQVRQPIYQSSSGRWRNYATQLNGYKEEFAQAGLLP
jgi:tetratricopeptide (TPR) repeat protein